MLAFVLSGEAAQPPSMSGLAGGSGLGDEAGQPPSMALGSVRTLPRVPLLAVKMGGAEGVGHRMPPCLTSNRFPQRKIFCIALRCSSLCIG